MKKNGILFALLIATGSLWAQTSTNLVPSAEITTTVTSVWGGGTVQDHINRIKDGNKDTSAPIAFLSNADGKNITFTWPSEFYTQGRFVYYNRINCCSNRIDTSTVAFFHGENRVYLDTILSAGDSIITITAPVDSIFNKVVLTFSGNTQNFREIEIFGTLAPSIYDSVRIAGANSVFVGDTDTLRATVFGINVDQTVKWSSSNTSVATVDSTGVVTGKTAGTVTITATSTADTSKFATKTISITIPPINIAPSAEITTTVTQFWQGDSASNVGEITDGNKTVEVIADLQNADGKNITFTWPSEFYTQGRFVYYNRINCCSNRIDTSTVAFFHGENRVYLDTILSAGDSIITITAPVDSTFNKVVLTFSGNDQNFREIEIFGTLAPSIYDSVSIQGPDTVFVGGTDTLSATVFGINADQTVKWSSSNTSVATVDSTGVVMGKTVGTATITATSTADSTKTDTKTITVPTPVVDSVRIAGDGSIRVGGTARFSATVFGTNVGQTVNWSSSDEAAATVNSNGVVTGKAVGTVDIIATSIVDTTKTDSITITIALANIAPRAEITTTVTSVWGGGTVQDHINRIKDGVTTSDANDSIADLADANGKNITFAWPSGLFTQGTFILYNRGAHQDRINSSTVAFFHGENRISIDTILSAGDTVTITAPVDSTFNKVVLTFSGDAQNFREIEIFGAPTPTEVDSVSITGDYSIWVGHTARFSATIFGINAPAQGVTWSSSDPTVATVDSTGLVTAVAVGEVSIKATSTFDDTKKDSTTISIIPVQTNLVPSAEITTTVTQYFSGDSALSVRNLKDGNKSHIYNIVDLSQADGKNYTFAWPRRLFHIGRFVFYNYDVDVYRDRINSSTVAFFHGDNRVYVDTILSAGGTVTIIVPADFTFNKVVITFSGNRQNFTEIEIFGTPTPSRIDSVSITGDDSVFVGGTTALTASVFAVNTDSTATFWSSSNPAVATVDSNTGVVTGKTVGTATITATSTADTSKFATKTITVPTPAVESVSVAGDGSIWVGGTARFSAAVFGTIIDKTVTWSSSDPTVATVDSSTGLVTAVAVGEVSIKATSTFDDTKTGSITIAIVDTQTTNLASRAEITTTVSSFSIGDSASNIALLTDGKRHADGLNDYFNVQGWPYGKTLTFAWPRGLFHTGRFVIYAADFVLNGSTVEFFNGDSSVHTSIISIARSGTVTIVPDFTAEFNKVVLTFSGGNNPQFAEIEIFGIPTPSVYESVSITGDGSIWVGDSVQFSATVVGVNVEDQTVTWSSSDSTVATVDSTGLVTAVAMGEVSIKATSTVDDTKTDSITIAITPVQTNIAPSAEITTTATIFLTGDSAHSVGVITNGKKRADEAGDYFEVASADGKTLSFAWPRGLFHTGRLVVYWDSYLDGSTVEFFNGDSSVYLDTISNPSGDDITIVPDFTAEFNKVVLTFSGNEQEFTEIEVYGTPTPSIYDSVSITGSDSVFVGDTLPLTATVFGVNADSTVIWSSSNTSVATVDSNGVVTGVAVGTATITATSTADERRRDTKTIAIVSNTESYQYHLPCGYNHHGYSILLGRFHTQCECDSRWSQKLRCE